MNPVTLHFSQPQELKMSRPSGAEGMNIPPLAVHAVPNGEKAVEALVI